MRHLNRVLGGQDEAMTPGLSSSPASWSSPAAVALNLRPHRAIAAAWRGVAVPSFPLCQEPSSFGDGAEIALTGCSGLDVAPFPSPPSPGSVSTDRPEQEAAGCRVSGLQEGSSAGRSADRQLTLSAAQVA